MHRFVSTAEKDRNAEKKKGQNKRNKIKKRDKNPTNPMSKLQPTNKNATQNAMENILLCEQIQGKIKSNLTHSAQNTIQCTQNCSNRWKFREKKNAHTKIQNKTIKWTLCMSFFKILSTQSIHRRCWLSFYLYRHCSSCAIQLLNSWIDCVKMLNRMRNGESSKKKTAHQTAASIFKNNNNNCIGITRVGRIVHRFLASRSQL